MAVDYQVSHHGAGRASVQVFDRESRELIRDCNIVREANGYRVLGGSRYDTPQPATPMAAAKHFAELVALERSAG